MKDFTLLVENESDFLVGTPDGQIITILKHSLIWSGIEGPIFASAFQGKLIVVKSFSTKFARQVVREPHWVRPGEYVPYDSFQYEQYVIECGTIMYGDRQRVSVGYDRHQRQWLVCK